MAWPALMAGPASMMQGERQGHNKQERTKTNENEVLPQTEDANETKSSFGVTLGNVSLNQLNVPSAQR